MIDLSPSSKPIRARHAFLLGLAAALFALLPALLPYGGRFVTRGDFIEQQLPFILEARRILRAGLDSYSFSTFLGAPSVGSYSFYTLGSPFVWPLALLPKAAIPYGIAVMALCKHAFAALCSFLYYKKMVKSDKLALLGSLLYTFSSFTIVNTQFYHFTEVIAFFPLILLGLEDAMGEHPHAGMLALFCGLNTLTNYYFMFGSALLAALYFVFRFFSADWKASRRLSCVVRTVFECGVGCALAGVLLVPTLIFMLSITRTGAGDTSLLAMRYAPAVLMERLRTMLMPIESNVLHAYYGDAASWASTACYLPVFGMTGVCVFALRGKKNGWLRALLAVLLVCSCVPALCGAFSLFSNTSYTRWWYALALLFSLATLFAIRDAGEKRRLWEISFALCTVLVLLLTVPFLLPEGVLALLPEQLGALLRNRRLGNYAPDALRALSIGLTLLGGGAMLLLLLKKPSFRAAISLVCAVAVIQYAGYIFTGDHVIRSGGETPAEGKYALSEIAEPTLSALELPEPTNYARIDYGPRLRNYGLLRGQSSLTCFQSLRSSIVGRFIGMAGFGYDESTTVTPPGASPAIRALLSVQEYHATDGENPPEGFVFDREENGFSVYRNENAVPMGFLQSTMTGTHHQRMAPDTVAQVMLAAVTLEDDMLSRFADRLQTLDVHHIPDWQESAARLRENACKTFAATPHSFSAQIDAKEAGLLVFTIPFDKGFTARIDGQDTEIIPCDVSFMGVFVEPGSHEIVFTYHTRGLALGVLMSALAAVVLAGYVVMMKRKRK